MERETNRERYAAFLSRLFELRFFLVAADTVDVVTPVWVVGFVVGDVELAHRAPLCKESWL